MANLTQKETYLLKDQKDHEEVCIKKYTNYANQTQDQQLKQLFNNLAQQEKQHLNTINQILNGQTPNMNQQGSQNMQNTQNTQNQGMQNNQNTTVGQSGMTNQNDADLCTDMLMTEKYVSQAYNSAIFEFKDHNIREALNHIQKEEQLHGESVYNYMQSKGMY